MAAYEVLLLNTAIPQIQAAQTGDTYVVPRAIAFNSGVNVVNNDVTIYGVTVGRGAGAVATNTAVGASALAGNTTGARLTAVGANAGPVNTASDNTFVGYNTGQVNTSGVNNTALGSQALATNISGGNNTAVGYTALLLNTGSNNTAVGGGTFPYATLSNNSSGAANTAIGTSALAQNTTASNNTAVGYQAGYSNQTGVANCFFGYLAGYSSIGSGNTFVGAGGSGGQNPAGYASTGSDNNFLGSRAGGGMTTGSKNTILGNYNGNQDSLDLRTSSNYIVLSDGDGNPRGVFDGSGNLLVGTTTSASSRLCLGYTGATILGQNINDSDNTTNSTFMQFQIQGTQVGTIKRVGATSAVVYNTTSDYRLKNVVGAVTGQGARIDALKPVDYLWKDGGQQARGFLAHEFQEVYPSSVSGDKDAVDADGKPMYQAMQASTSEVIADLVAELQSLRARVAQLESKL